MFKIIKKLMAKTKKVVKSTKKVKVVKKVELTNQEIYDSLGKRDRRRRRSELGV